MNAFYANLISKLGEDGFHKVQAARIGLAGLGGLGSNCALNLVRTGFRKFAMADFDSIDHSNLDRQFYFSDQVGKSKAAALKTNLLRINPDLEIKSLKLRIGKDNIEELFRACQIVAECLDSSEEKSALVAELLRLRKFVVSASGLGGYGASDEIRTHRVKDNLIIVGDLRSDICMKPALSPRVNIAASKQADAILEHVMGE